MEYPIDESAEIECADGGRAVGEPGIPDRLSPARRAEAKAQPEPPPVVEAQPEAPPQPEVQPEPPPEFQTVLLSVAPTKFK